MAEAQGKLIQHLGIVAGVCNEIGLVNLIDAHIGKHGYGAWAVLSIGI